jgi:autotransporter-associated beta strand protein
MKITSLHTLLLSSALLALPATLPALIVGPYTPEAHTLHLWHLDADGVPVPDAAPSGGTNLVSLFNGATLGNASYQNGAINFGGSLSTVDAGQDVITNRDALLTAWSGTGTPGNVSITIADPVTGAFTFEAVLWIGFDPAKNFGTTANGGNNRNTPFNIITGESTANANRIFQFRIVPVGMDPDGSGPAGPTAQPLLTFENVRMVSGNQPTIYAAIPTSGPDAIVSNGWFHVAVTYNGVPNTAGNLKLYWTAMDPGNVACHEIALTSTQTTLSGLNPSATVITPFMIGNDGRNRNSNFIGLVDEVRISKVALAPGAMMFAAPTITFSLNPSNTVAAVGQPVTLTVAASGVPPLAYQWRKAGLPIPAATGMSFTLPAATPDDAGSYDVVVTNLISLPATSAVATVTIRSSVDSLIWQGTTDANWDLTTPNWKNAVTAAAPVLYQPGDQVRFEENGPWWNAVMLNGTIMPGSILVDPNSEFLDYTFTGPGSLVGPMSLTKAGPATLILDCANLSTGPTTISGGILQVGNGGANGTLGTGPVTNHAVLAFNRSGTLLLPNVITGLGAVSNVAGTVILTATNNAWTGGVGIAAGALQIGDGGANGSLGSGPIIDHGTLVFSTLNDLTVANPIAGNGGLTKNASNTLVLAGANSYTNLTVINDGTLIPAHASALGSADGHTAPVGGTAISRLGLQGGITLAEPIRCGGRQPLPNASALAAHVINLGGTNTLTGAITAETGGNQYNLESAAGLLRVEGDYAQVVGTGDRFLNLQGAGEADWLGAINNGLANVNLTKRGPGTWTLSGANGYTGPTLVQEGLLRINGSIISANVFVTNTGSLGGTGSIAGPVSIGWGGTLAPGASIGTLTINHHLTLMAGSFTSVEVNQLDGTCDQVLGVTNLSYGGTLVVANLAGTLSLHDSFKLFTAESYAGAFDAVQPASPGAGLAWDTSTLATDGTLRIKVGINPTPEPLAYSLTGTQLTLSWPADHTGWRLQQQINPLGVGIGSNWIDVAGSTTTNQVILTIDVGTGCGFYRLVLP